MNIYQDPIGVTIGGCIGHSICTGGAVIGGRMLASRISEKTGEKDAYTLKAVKGLY